MMPTSKAHVKPSEWAAASKAERDLVKGRGGFKPTNVRPLTREEHKARLLKSADAFLDEAIARSDLAVNPTSTATALLLVLGELKRTETRQLPADPLRRCALVNEEAGEALRAVLDLTRDPALSKAMRNEVRRELVQCASMAVTVIAAMIREDADVDVRDLTWSTDAAAAVAAHPIKWDSKRKALRYKKR